LEKICFLIYRYFHLPIAKQHSTLCPELLRPKNGLLPPEMTTLMASPSALMLQPKTKNVDEWAL
jgi:hypothetical protein